MRMGLVWFVFGGLVGGAAGFVGGTFAFPYIFQADVVADEPLTSAEHRTVIAQGGFVDASPNDPIHYGRGRVTVYPNLVRLEPDFEVGPGPDYHVYLVAFGNVRGSDDVAGSRIVDLGRLRAFKGAQNFDIPDGVELRDYRSVVIWCEAFELLVSPATLAFSD